MAQVAPILDSQDEDQDEGSDWEYEYDPNELEVSQPRNPPFLSLCLTTIRIIT